LPLVAHTYTPPQNSDLHSPIMSEDHDENEPAWMSKDYDEQ
jgi:hypothetical protein